MRADLPVGKFTPGPWTVEADGSIEHESGQCICVPSYAEDFPCLDDEERPAVDEECAANAQLIAAAPDLFASAQAQEEASAASLSASEACPDGQAIPSHIAAQVESLFAHAEKLRRNAIAKATGAQ